MIFYLLCSVVFKLGTDFITCAFLVALSSVSFTGSRFFTCICTYFKPRDCTFDGGRVPGCPIVERGRGIKERDRWRWGRRGCTQRAIRHPQPCPPSGGPSARQWPPLEPRPVHPQVVPLREPCSRFHQCTRTRRLAWDEGRGLERFSLLPNHRHSACLHMLIIHTLSLIVPSPICECEYW